jgi:glutaminyl-peptide cyclotransferase
LDRKVARTLLVAAWLGAAPGCERSDPAPPPPPVAAASGFDGERAFRDLVEQVRLGPRHPGTPGSAAVRELIRARLRQAGWVARDHAFEAELPDGTRTGMLNLIGDLPGAGPGVVMLVTHYDTKRLPHVPQFAGANDGASGVAVLLELARVLPRRPRALGYQLVFFDGEEAFGPHIRAGDGLYGSRALAAKLQAEDALAQLRALVLVDMVGDSDLNVSWGADSSPELVSSWVELARARGVALEGPMALVDDHTPFVDAGVARVLSLIDFHYGERVSPGWRWHGRGDALEAVSAASLDRFGNLLVEWLARVEPQLAGERGANATR